MPLYTSTGSFNVVTDDTTKGRYSPTGALRINLVSGTSYTGLYAADGALNVVDVSGVSISTYGGLYHPCGALRGRTAPDTYSGLQAPDGSYYLYGLSQPFTPAELFALGEQGVWYDPSDLTTLFQDAAGTTPVSAMEQPVGLVLDKSRGLTLGSEKWTGSPTLAANWSGSGGTYTSNGGTGFITVAAIGSAYLTVGKVYKTSFTVSNVTSGSVSSPYDGEGTNGAYKTANGTYERIFRAAADGLYIYSNGFAGTVSNITVKEVTGNHASQTTAASRPVVSARYNLLTRTEEFDNAAWTKTETSIGAIAIANPVNGAVNADLVIASATTGYHYVRQTPAGMTAASYTLSAYAKAGGYNYVEFHVDDSGGQKIAVVFNLTNGAKTETAGSGTATPLGDGWYFLQATGTTTSAPTLVQYNVASGTTQGVFLGNGTSGVYLWGADLRVSNDGVGLPAYQRVGASTDYDTTGFPVYLRFDGTDDGLSTGSIDFTSTDKMSVFAGVRNIGTTAYGLIAEIGTTGNDAGSWTLCLGASASAFLFASGGTSRRFAETAASFTPPTTRVLRGVADIAGDYVGVLVNGGSLATSVLDQGTGNFGNLALFMGRRNNASLPFNGRLTSLIVRGAATDAATITSTETWVNSKTMAYDPTPPSLAIFDRFNDSILDRFNAIIETRV